jgi:acyl-coenzyme A thioesterase PaaI-like protein
VTFQDPEFSPFIKNNAFHDTLSGQGMVELFQVYMHKESKEIYAIVQFGSRLNGYPHLVHGGISSLVIDSIYGWTFMAQKLPAAFTANLNVNFRLEKIQYRFLHYLV